MSDNLGKLPPQAIELERAVLGAMQLDKIGALTGIHTLSETSFYKSEHQLIFKAMKTLSERNSEIDSLTVVEQLKKDGNLQIVGGPVYIMQLTDKVASSAHIEQHCFILLEKEMARKQIDVANELIKRAFNDSFDVFETTDYMAEVVHNIQNIGDLQTDESNAAIIHQIAQDIEEAGKAQGITGVKTGLREKDMLFGGWKAPDFIIWGARPGMGKTAFMLTEVFNSAVAYDYNVLVFSLEMSKKQLMTRMATMATGIGAEKLKNGSLSPEEWKQFHDNIGQLDTENITIVDQARTISQIRSRVKRERMSRKIDIIYIDYIQLIKVDGKGSREQEISFISRELKELAVLTNTPIIGLSQLSRKLEERGDKRPRLTDLRESGALEQDADIVCFLHRPAYYGEDDPNSYFIVAKHRNGMLADIILKYIHQQTRFVEWDNYNQTF